jgi:SsrA-binding protein
MRIPNKFAKSDYELYEKVEAGVVLSGPEVKSVKLGQIDLSRGYIKILPNKFGQHEVWLLGVHIYPYAHADNSKYDPARARKLLLHQREILALETRMKQARLLIVPLAMYTHSGNIKLELALARGKKKFEKREDIKKRDLDREGGKM